jgi:hypothetical protein
MHQFISSIHPVLGFAHFHAGRGAGLFLLIMLAILALGIVMVVTSDKSK